MHFYNFKQFKIFRQRNRWVKDKVDHHFDLLAKYGSDRIMKAIDDLRVAVKHQGGLDLRRGLKREETDPRKVVEMSGMQMMKNPLHVAQEVAERNAAALWEEQTTKEGKKYYYNTQTGETSWSAPKGFRISKGKEPMKDAAAK